MEKGMEGEPEAYRDDTLRSISISPRERLERIENVLERIDTKLDAKADVADLIALEGRVKAAEVCIERAERLKEDQKELQSLYARLHEDHERLKNRIAYYFGAAATGVVVGKILLERTLG